MVAEIHSLNPEDIISVLQKYRDPPDSPVPEEYAELRLHESGWFRAKRQEKHDDYEEWTGQLTADRTEQLFHELLRDIQSDPDTGGYYDAWQSSILIVEYELPPITGPSTHDHAEYATNLSYRPCILDKSPREPLTETGNTINRIYRNALHHRD